MKHGMKCVLRTKKVVVRRQPLSAEHVQEAARLYESGLSLSQVASKLHVNQETMRVAIIKAGPLCASPRKPRKHEGI